MKVIKRDGSLVEFQGEKIRTALTKAFESTKGKLRNEDKEGIELVYKNVLGKIKQKTINIEDIQDLVEVELSNNGYFDVARNYIKYRYKRTIVREGASNILDAKEIYNNYMNKSDWEVYENANMRYSLQGFNNRIVSAISEKIWLEDIYPERVSIPHNEGRYHIHDLGLISTYCCGWDMEDLLKNGFGGVEGKPNFAPPKHFKSVLGQLVNFIYTLQGEAAGAQAVSSFDTYLAPFVRFDKLDYKEVKQSIQEFICNMNISTRVGFQSPFSNVTLDVKCPKHMENQPIIIDGKTDFNYTYGEFQDEMDLINMAFCEVMIEGDKDGRIYSFPIPTYNITEQFDWDSEVSELILEMTRKYGTPYFSNFINSDMDPEDVRSMCCRLRISNTELRKRGGGLFGANPMTGSINVITMNMARLGYENKGDLEKFKKELKHLMTLAKESMEIKRKVLELNTEKGFYPYSKVYLESVKLATGGYWDNHFNTIGLNGMNECIRNFTDDKEDITTKWGSKFAQDILEFMNEVIVEFQKESGQLYNLEATPAEATAYRLAQKDVKVYPDIITAGTKEIPYYTNSTQLPVGYTDDIFEALRLQEPLQTKYTGGTVFHGFFNELIEDIDSLKTLIKTVLTKYEIPYFTYTPTFSICKNHGYLQGELEFCTKCGEKTEIWTRVVGFHRPVQSWNEGKKQEYKERKEFI